MNRGKIIAVVAAMSAVAACVLFAIRANEWRSKAEKFDARCGLVRVAIRSDWQDLQLPEFQREAASRFLEPVAGHSYDEVALCVSAAIDLERHADCQRRLDYPCLAAMAKSVEMAIPTAP